MVSQYLSGARTLESRPAVLLDNDEVPVLQQSIRNARIVYFHTQDNPYNSWTATKNQLKGSSRDEILTKSLRSSYKTSRILSSDCSMIV